MKKSILTKILLLILIATVTICGCGNNSKPAEENETSEEEIVSDEGIEEVQEEEEEEASQETTNNGRYTYTLQGGVELTLRTRIEDYIVERDGAKKFKTEDFLNDVGLDTSHMTSSYPSKDLGYTFDGTSYIVFDKYGGDDGVNSFALRIAYRIADHNEIEVIFTHSDEYYALNKLGARKVTTFDAIVVYAYISEQLADNNSVDMSMFDYCRDGTRYYP